MTVGQRRAESSCSKHKDRFAVTPGGSDKTSLSDGPISHQRLQSEQRRRKAERKKERRRGGFRLTDFIVWMQERCARGKRKGKRYWIFASEFSQKSLMCPQKVNRNQPIEGYVYPISRKQLPGLLADGFCFVFCETAHLPIDGSTWSPNITASSHLWLTESFRFWD